MGPINSPDNVTEAQSSRKKEKHMHDSPSLCASVANANERKAAGGVSMKPI
jgi:hypothetical protein